jgi:hypothetical protein
MVWRIRTVRRVFYEERQPSRPTAGIPGAARTAVVEGDEPARAIIEEQDRDRVALRKPAYRAAPRSRAFRSRRHQRRHRPNFSTLRRRRTLRRFPQPGTVTEPKRVPPSLSQGVNVMPANIEETADGGGRPPHCPPNAAKPSASRRASKAPRAQMAQSDERGKEQPVGRIAHTTAQGIAAEKTARLKTKPLACSAVFWSDRVNPGTIRVSSERTRHG